MDLLKFADRIVTTPMPFAYYHMLSMLVFIFVYVTPLLYCGPLETGQGWTSCIVITFCCYGLLEVGICLENPFGWDETDLDLEKFGKVMALESDVIAVTARTERGLKSVELRTDADLTVRSALSVVTDPHTINAAKERDNANSTATEG